MPPERVAACGDIDTRPPAPGPWAGQGASVNGTRPGTGAGVRKMCSLLYLLGTSTESDIQGQKPAHDRKIKKHPVPCSQSH